MCVFECAMPPSMSVTREQQVWGEYGIYTAHIHTYLFKIIHKRHLKIPRKEVQTPPKSSPRDHLKPKNHGDVAGTRKKSILGGRVPRRARQKDPKVDPQTGPRAPEFNIYLLYKQNMIRDVSLDATAEAFGGENGDVLSTFRAIHTVMNSSLIFKGCTVRFACFCHGNCFRFASKNSPR